MANAVYMGSVRATTLTSSLLLTILTARMLGPQGRGVYALPLIDASLATTFAAGLSSALSYALLQKRVGHGIVPLAALGMLAFAGVGALATVITAWANHSLWAIVPALVYMAGYAGYSLVYGYFFGRDRVRAAGLVNAITYITTLLAVGLALLLYSRSPHAAIVACVTTMFVAGIAGMCLVFRSASKLQGNEANIPRLLVYAMKAGFLNVANLLNYRVDIFIVAAVAPISILGLYTIAVTGAESAFSLTQAVAQATVPRIGALDRQSAAEFTARCVRNSLFVALILSGTAAMLAAPIVHLLFGGSFDTIVWPLRLLLIGVVAITTTTVISNYFLLNRARVALPLQVSLISAALCGALTFLSVPRIGMLGAAFGSTVGYLFGQALSVYYFCRETGIAPLDVLVINQSDIAVYGRIMRRILRKAPA